MELKQVIKIWQELNIDRAVFDFSCGGDSMGDTSLSFFDKKDNIVNSDELETYFGNQVYNKVSFYDSSDGYYQGESGSVTITFDNDAQDFNYSKQSEAEYSERYTRNGYLKLTDEQVKFIKNYVDNINGAEGEGFSMNFSCDFIMGDKEEEIADELEELIGNFVDSFEFQNVEGEPEDWYTFTTNELGDELEIDSANRLKIQISKSFIEYKPSDW